jgi:hypothetical protein
MKYCVVAVYTICNKYGLYVDAVVVLTPSQYDDGINIQIVYTTTLQDFMRTVTTK